MCLLIWQFSINFSVHLSYVDQCHCLVWLSVLYVSESWLSPFAGKCRRELALLALVVLFVGVSLGCRSLLFSSAARQLVGKTLSA